MKVNHHLDDATLMSLSAGTLGEALSIVAAAHVGICSLCRSKMRELDALGGVLLTATEQADLNEGTIAVWTDELSEETVRAAGGRGRDQNRHSHGARPDGELPGPLAKIIDQPLDQIKWKWLGPGVSAHVLKLSDSADGDVRLLKVAPNKRLPEHGHGGTELTMIISGAYRDQFGVFGPGDVADMDEDVEHQPVVEPGEPCICVVACEAPARFKGPIARLLQPWFGM